MKDRSAILQGTLDLMVLKTLEQMGTLHGYGIGRRIEQVAHDTLVVNQGTIYLCLVRLMQKKWISGTWGTSENNRKAKFYSVTVAGRSSASEANARMQSSANPGGRSSRARSTPTGRPTRIAS